MDAFRGNRHLGTRVPGGTQGLFRGLRRSHGIDEHAQHAVDIQVRRIHDMRIRSRPEGIHGPVPVLQVALLDAGLYLFQRGPVQRSAGFQLKVAAPGAHFGARIQEELMPGERKDLGTHVAPFRHERTFRPDRPLRLLQLPAQNREPGHHGSKAPGLFRAYLHAHRHAAAAQDGLPAAPVLQGEPALRTAGPQRCIVHVRGFRPQAQPQGPVHCPRVKIGDAEGIGKAAGQRALAYARRSVHGDDADGYRIHAFPSSISRVRRRKSAFSSSVPTLTRSHSGR